MRCFFHEAKEAIAACRKCGKGMCVDCSSYDNHSGICPNCKKEDFKKEISEHIKDNSSQNGQEKLSIKCHEDVCHV